MGRKQINIVWFKRDFRLTDHAPLKLAVEDGLSVLLIAFAEPELLHNPHYETRHWRFVQQSVAEMNRELAAYGSELYLLRLSAQAGFERLADVFEIKTVYSYQETGLDVTFARDRALARFFKSKGVVWREFVANGVFRGLRDRKDWRTRWRNWMIAPLDLPELKRLKPVMLPELALRFRFASLPPARYEADPKQFQPGGRGAALKYKRSFFAGRCEHYQRHISKPEAARKSCARLSPYIAWGNLSMREVWQETRARLAQGKHKRALSALESRLRWHGHIIQKFEMEPEMEFRALNKACDAPAGRWSEAAFRAWKEGETGFPLVDATMRCLRATGWVNFRMRAMVVSFLTHLLRLDWREGAKELALLFLDFEPGIHYYQFQMQAALTGIHTIRVYNPALQAERCDPEAVFIKKWLPELRKLPDRAARNPARLAPMEEVFYDFKLGRDYPAPIIPLGERIKAAQDFFWRRQYENSEARREAARILDKHTLPGRRP